LCEPSEFIEKKKKEILETFIGLIKARTENPPGDVSSGIKIISGILDRYEIDYKIFEPEKGKQNLVASIGSGKTLILNGHIDVVPAGEKWTYDPFTGYITENKVYGRGTSDMKSGVVALLYSFLACASNPPGKIILSVVCDEETGGSLGSKYLLEKGEIFGDACLIAEPTGSLKTGKYYIIAGEKGALWVKLIARGKAAHGSIPMVGDNAIFKLTGVLNSFKDGILERVSVPPDAMKLVNNSKEWLSTLHPRAIETLDHLSINVGKISGGKKVNMVPDYAEAEIDIRIPLGTTALDALNILRKRIPQNVDLEVIHAIEPSYIPSDHQLIKVMQKSGYRYLGYNPVPALMPATTDARLFRMKNIPTINFGPGYLETAHTIDEFVYIDDIIVFTKIYSRFIQDFYMTKAMNGVSISRSVNPP